MSGREPRFFLCSCSINAASRIGPPRSGSLDFDGCSLLLPILRFDEFFWDDKPEIRDPSEPRLLDEDVISNGGDTVGLRCVPCEDADMVGIVVKAPASLGAVAGHFSEVLGELLNRE